jgi:hypothetical protein
MRHLHRLAAVASLLAALTLAACGGGSSGSGAPASHTLNQGGTPHAPGLHDPLTNCVACHGDALQGGEGPSCTSCHGVKW